MTEETRKLYERQPAILRMIERYIDFRHTLKPEDKVIFNEEPIVVKIDTSLEGPFNKGTDKTIEDKPCS
jgi:hypothetical protein